MKKEKLAEEYADSVDGYEIKTYSISDIEQAFLAGFKAGEPQWHNLRENPNDLPDTDRNVLVKRESEENSQLDNYYNDDDYIGWGAEQWDREYYKRKGDVGYPSDVIAWCELPKWED